LLWPFRPRVQDLDQLCPPLYSTFPGQPAPEAAKGGEGRLHCSGKADQRMEALHSSLACVGIGGQQRQAIHPIDGAAGDRSDFQANR
jgi:hypothetical protein